MHIYQFIKGLLSHIIVEEIEITTTENMKPEFYGVG